ncbi:MAG: acylneuraminate cytidylyltransferase family protein [Pseudorhodoplanes sp.]|uniref:acylneuraminate cytidylyltransferase family protein n=1 Tax=Pseudorhodoplanes sp. TaxID=1934341 RepID=UPI003D0AE239
MNHLCTICARGGSKGVPGKNLRPVLGKPLIAYTIDQARQSGLFAAIAVSSDSADILAAARAGGADILVPRPPELASDEAAKVPAIRHCLDYAERELQHRFAVFVDLDVTAPLRLPEDIVGAVALLEQRDVSSVVTGTPSRRSPYYNMVECDERGVVRLAKPLPRELVRRQDAPVCYDLNASIYVWNRDRFCASPAVFYDDTLLFEMPPERSIDIDSELDFEIVQMLLSKRARAAP